MKAARKAPATCLALLLMTSSVGCHTAIDGHLFKKKFSCERFAVAALSQNRQIISVNSVHIDPDLVQLNYIFYAQKPNSCVARLAQVNSAHQDAIWFYDALEHRTLKTFDDSGAADRFISMVDQANTFETVLRGSAEKYDSTSSKSTP